MTNRTNKVVSEKLITPVHGEIEFIIKDRNGNILDVVKDRNIVKIFAKEILAHRVGYSKVWDPDAGTDGIGLTAILILMRISPSSTSCLVHLLMLMGFR